jgi:hypothetical protein
MYLLSFTQTYYAAATLSCMRNAHVWEDSSSVHCSKCFSLSSTHYSYKCTKIENLIPLRCSLKSVTALDVRAECYNYYATGVSCLRQLFARPYSGGPSSVPISSMYFCAREKHTQGRILVLLFRFRISCLSYFFLTRQPPSGPRPSHSRGF